MKTILLVDDDELLRDLFGGALRKKGYHVIEADSGVEGFEKAQKNLPDLILSDICMPREMARPRARDLSGNSRCARNSLADSDHSARWAG
jgi:CheY-like chemotaxis protein